MMRQRISGFRWAVFGLLLVAGCGTSAREEAVTFHAAIGDATQIVEAADLQFMMSLLPVVRGEKSDPAAIKNDFEGVGRALGEARAKLAATPVPDTTTARALLEVHKKFLDRHEKSLAGDFAEAVKVVEAKDLEPAARATRVRSSAVLAMSTRS